MQTQEIAKAYAKFYEELSPRSKREDYGVFFDKNSEFSDPFQSVKGLGEIYNIFLNMYKSLHNPRFVVDEVVSSDDVAYIRWRFYYSLSESAKADSFTGVSRVTFTPGAKVKSHIDYWDAAEHVYEKIPLLGSILRYIKRRVHAG